MTKAMDDSFESVIETYMFSMFKSSARFDALPFKTMKGAPLVFLKTSISLNLIPFEKPLPNTFEHASLQAKLLLR